MLFKRDLFKVKKAVTKSQNAKAMKVYVAPGFLWGFLMAWKQTKDHGNDFVKQKWSLLAAYEKQSASVNPLPLLNMAKIPPPQQPSVVKGSKVALSGTSVLKFGSVLCLTLKRERPRLV